MPKTKKNTKNVPKNKNKSTNKKQAFTNPSDRQMYKPTVKRMQMRAPKLSPCALKYAMALSRPFDARVRGVCLGTYPAMPSSKRTGLTSFDAWIGSAGFGFVAFTPTSANDSIAAWYSNPTYGVASATYITATNVLQTGVSLASFTNLPFNSATMNNTNLSSNSTVSARVVCYGVRASYAGTALNESGFIYSYTNPYHSNVTTTPVTTISGITPYSETFRKANDREVLEYSIFPVNSRETAYPDFLTNTITSIYPYSQTTTIASIGNYAYNGYNAGNPVSVLYFTGVAGQFVHIDIIEHLEYTGEIVEDIVTNSEADENGYDLVTAGATLAQQIRAQFPHKDTWTAMYEAMSSIAKSVAPTVVPKSMLALSDMVSKMEL